MIDCYHRRDSVLTDADLQALRNVPKEGADVRDYNMFMALCRGFHMGYMLGEWTCADAGLQMSFLERMVRDANKRRTVELFESFGPHIVTRKQYEDIVAAQKQKKLEFEYSLGHVIEERFYAIAPPEAREETDEARVEYESIKDFVSAVPQKYEALCKQAIDEVRHRHTSGKLPAVFHKEDAKEAGPLLAQWKKNQLSAQDTMKLVDILYVSGQQLHDCARLSEWRAFVGQYQQHWFADEDERFRYTYAVLEDYPKVWVDQQGYFRESDKSSEWITRSTELYLDLIDHDDKPKKSIQSVGAELRDKLDTAEQNIGLLLAVKAILDTAAEGVGLDILGKEGVLAGPYMRLGAYIALYNIRLEELREERGSQESAETRLEKALKLLPAIDSEKLKPSPEALKQLKADVLKDAHGEEWLRTKIMSLDCGDGFSFKELVKE